MEEEQKKYENYIITTNRKQSICDSNLTSRNEMNLFSQIKIKPKSFNLTERANNSSNHKNDNKYQINSQETEEYTFNNEAIFLQ